MQNGVVAKACARAFNSGGCSSEMEGSLLLPEARRLDIRKRKPERAEALLGTSDLAKNHPAGRAGTRHPKAVWLAYLPAHFLDSVAKRWNGIQSHARDDAAFLTAL